MPDNNATVAPDTQTFNSGGEAQNTPTGRTIDDVFSLLQEVQSQLLSGSALPNNNLPTDNPDQSSLVDSGLLSQCSNLATLFAISNQLTHICIEKVGEDDVTIYCRPCKQYLQFGEHLQKPSVWVERSICGGVSKSINELLSASKFALLKCKIRQHLSGKSDQFGVFHKT